MMRVSIAAAAAVFGLMNAAAAADLPFRSAPSAPYDYGTPLFTWIGFYVGVNAGAGFGTDAGRVVASGFTPANGFAAGPPTGSFGPVRGPEPGIGFVGGGQAGYNIQSAQVVYGLEADIDYFGAGAGGSRTFADPAVFTAPNSTLTLGQRGGSGYLGTVRGRLGYAGFERTLLYVTGGLAYGDYGPTYGVARFNNGAGPQVVQFDGGSGGDTRIGYAVGAGAEYAVTTHVSAKAEYLYTDIGDRSYALTNPNTGALLRARSDGSAQMVRLGLNYRF